MAIMVTNIRTPNASGATPQLTENLLLSRDAMRTEGQRVGALRLIPCGGAVPGEMALAVEFEDMAAYAKAVSAGVTPAMAEAQGSMQYSNSAPVRATTWSEIPGL